MKARNQSFGQTAKIRLIQRGMSVGALAEKVGAHRCNVSLALNGTRHLPTLKEKIRKELGL